MYFISSEDSLNVQTESSGYGNTSNIEFNDTSGEDIFEPFIVSANESDMSILELDMNSNNKREFRSKYKKFFV